jgi:hypothetical protein
MLAPLPSAAADGLADRILKLTRATKWSEVAAIKIGFNTFHPQGIGENFFVSSVDIVEPTKRFPECATVTIATHRLGADRQCDRAGAAAEGRLSLSCRRRKK